jgi:hypothetical protein
MLVLAIEFSKGNIGSMPTCSATLPTNGRALMHEEDKNVAPSKRNRDSQAFAFPMYEDESYEYMMSTPAN